MSTAQVEGNAIASLARGIDAAELRAAVDIVAISVPGPLLVLLGLFLSLLVCGVAGRVRALVMGPLAESPYEHLRHVNKANAAWRPARADLLRRLLFFATGRRMTTDFLYPLLQGAVFLLLAASALPAAWTAHAMRALRDARDDPLSAVIIVGSSILLQGEWRTGRGPRGGVLLLRPCSTLRASCRWRCVRAPVLTPPSLPMGCRHGEERRGWLRAHHHARAL